MKKTICTISEEIRTQLKRHVNNNSQQVYILFPRNLRICYQTVVNITSINKSRFIKISRLLYQCGLTFAQSQ